MDEGTSALDVTTERRVNAALKDLQIPRIVAAHRPETLAAADRVIGLQEGRLAPLKFEMRPVAATAAEARPDLPKALYTDGLGLKRDKFDL